MRRLFSFLLVLSMLLSLACTASAATPEAVESANALHDLGLFQGVGTNQDGTPNYDLDRSPNRMEAVTMLVRLLGKENEAKAGTWNTPFTDVAEWAKPYVGYAYANGLTSGTSAKAFSGQSLVSATQYLTFILRALGYDSSKDFQWDKAWELTDKLGITNGQYRATIHFMRGDVAVVSNRALLAQVKGQSMTLLSTLRPNSNSENYKRITLEALNGVWHGYSIRWQHEEEYIFNIDSFSRAFYNQKKDLYTYEDREILKIDESSGTIWWPLTYYTSNEGWTTVPVSFEIEKFTGNTFESSSGTLFMKVGTSDFTDNVIAILKSRQEDTPLTESNKNIIRSCISIAASSDASGAELIKGLMLYDLKSMMATGSTKAQYELLKSETLDAIHQSCSTSKTSINKILETCKNKSGTENVVTNANKAIACYNDIINIKTVDEANIEKMVHLYEDLVVYLTNISNEVNK